MYYFWQQVKKVLCAVVHRNNDNALPASFLVRRLAGTWIIL